MWTVPPLLIVLVAAAYPLLRVCLESTKVGDTQRGWSTWSEVLASQMFRDALWRTVSIAVTSTAGCLVLGMFLAIVLAFVPFPGSRVVGRLIDTVLAHDIHAQACRHRLVFLVRSQVQEAVVDVVHAHDGRSALGGVQCLL